MLGPAMYLMQTEVESVRSSESALWYNGFKLSWPRETDRPWKGAVAVFLMVVNSVGTSVSV